MPWSLASYNTADGVRSIRAGEWRVSAPIFSPLADNALIGVMQEAGEIIVVTWPELELVRKEKYGAWAGLVRLDAARRVCLNLADDELVCRDATDLRVRWTIGGTGGRSSGPGYFVSPDGSCAAFVRRCADCDRTDSWLCAIVECENGKRVGELRVPYRPECGALSKGGSILALGELAWREGGAHDQIVRLYSVADGSEVASTVHASLPPMRSSLLVGAFPDGVHFTADGRYLVTTGFEKTRIWEVLPG